MQLPFVFSRIPSRDFAGTSINPVPIDSGSHVGVAATFGIVDFAENKAEISVRRLFGAVCDAVRRNALFVDAVARWSKSKAASSSSGCDREPLSAMKGEIRTIATAAMALVWKRRFMNQHSKIVSRQSSLQDPHHENYEKHRYVFAGDLFDR